MFHATMASRLSTHRIGYQPGVAVSGYVVICDSYGISLNWNAMNALERFVQDQNRLCRRYFLQMGAAGAATGVTLSLRAEVTSKDARLQDAIDRLESFLTLQADFQDVSRGKPLPHTLSDEKKRAVGMSRETWKLEVQSDTEHPASVRKPMTAEQGTAFDFQALMTLAETRSVRFPKVMTCLNIGCPLGMGIWEGVPLRDVIWQTRPQRDLRRVFYYGYHNDDPKQIFRSSLSIGRVFEDPTGLPPVILCYKLNGEWLTSERGGPVRMVVPEAYGFKSIKWLSNVVLTNLPHANDTYADGNNDIDSPLKTFAATLGFPKEVRAGEPIPITGYAQVGISGLKKIQYWIQDKRDKQPAGDRHFTQAPWKDADILSPPTHWSGELADDKIPPGTLGFDTSTNQPKSWPLRLGKVHWAALAGALQQGEYTLRCRTIDDNSVAQPMPRPFRKSGHCAIESVLFKVI